MKRRCGKPDQQHPNEDISGNAVGSEVKTSVIFSNSFMIGQLFIFFDHLKSLEWIFFEISQEGMLVLLFLAHL